MLKLVSRGRIQVFSDLDDAKAAMSRTKRDATLYNGNDVVGWVWKNEGRWTWMTDDINCEEEQAS